MSFKPRRTKAPAVAPVSAAKPAEFEPPSGENRPPLPPPEVMADAVAESPVRAEASSVSEIPEPAAFEATPVTAEKAAIRVVSSPPARTMEPPSAGPSSRQAPAIDQAIGEAKQIIESLKTVLEDLEEVLDLLEQVREDKSADENQIEALRRELRALRNTTGRNQPSRPPSQTGRSYGRGMQGSNPDNE